MYRNISSTLFLLFFASCALTQKQAYQFKLTQGEIYPGLTKKMTYQVPKESEEHQLSCDNKRMGHSLDGVELRTFISLGYWSEKKSYTCLLKFRMGGHEYEGEVFKFKITSFKYPTRRILVDKKHVDLSPKNLKRFLLEKEEIKQAYKRQVYDRAFFDSAFMRPLKSKVTSVYGSKRIFNNKKRSWHSGVDLRARTPTPIPVSNDGKVLFTKDLFFNGKAVFVDHGMGIVTLYCHLSKIKVSEGDMVKRGDIIGISGNTGRSSAPHLHWGTKVNGNWVSGLNLIDEGI